MVNLSQLGDVASINDGLPPALHLGPDFFVEPFNPLTAQHRGVVDVCQVALWQPVQALMHDRIGPSLDRRLKLTDGAYRALDGQQTVATGSGPTGTPARAQMPDGSCNALRPGRRLARGSLTICSLAVTPAAADRLRVSESPAAPWATDSGLGNGPGRGMELQVDDF